MPAVNGHVVGSPALHASSSISSLEPATTMLEWLASIAMAGSFCLFCENGVGGLPLATNTSAVVAADEAVAPSTSARAAANSRDVLRMAYSPLIATPEANEADPPSLTRDGWILQLGFR